MHLVEVRLKSSDDLVIRTILPVLPRTGEILWVRNPDQESYRVVEVVHYVYPENNASNATTLYVEGDR